MAMTTGAVSSGIHNRRRRRHHGSGVECCEAICIILNEYAKEIPSPRSSRQTIKSSGLGQNESTRKKLTVLTEVELMGLVCVSWSCPVGMPDIGDRHSVFCSCGRVKMLYMSVRGKQSMGSMYANTHFYKR